MDITLLLMEEMERLMKVMDSVLETYSSIVIPHLEDTFEEWGFLPSNNSSPKARAITNHPSSTSCRK
jgi:hypothetical protein